MKTLVKNKSTKRDKTPEILVEMLKENTGISMCDSGGKDGRHYQRNAKKALKDFEKEPLITGEFQEYSGKVNVSASKSLFHFLKENLQYNEKLTKDFLAYAEMPQNEGDHWLSLMESWPKDLEKNGYEIAGLYGEGKPFTTNSYNGESTLSQVIQYVYFEIDGDSFVVLQTHNGADVRGGYSTPKVFNVNEGLLIDSGIHVTCSKDNNHVWVSDDCGYHNHFEGQWTRPEINGKSSLLPNMGKFIENLPMPEPKRHLEDYSIEELNYMDGKAYCPLCFMAEKEKNELTID
jgi:hypothetical protein